MTILNDNTVIPSYLSSSEQGVRWMDPGDQTNLALRYGEVRGIVYPTDPKSLSKRFVEYTVEVQQKDANGPGAAITYANCLQMGLFGTSADFFKYTLRADDKQGRKSSLGVGAKVVLMCLNGDTTRALIVGALRDTGTDKDGSLPGGRDEKEDGHNLAFEFNGVQVTINKDGELQVRYRGQTKVDGTLSDDANKDAEGSTVVFDKEGSIKLYTKDEKQFVHLNNKDKKLEILADEEWNVKVNKKLSFEAGDDVSLKGDKSCVVEMGSRVSIKSAGVDVGDATDAWLLAETYRRAETQMLKQIATTMQALTGLVATAGASLTAASAANAPPIVGGLAAAAPFAAAGGALTSAGPLFAQMGLAIEAFEAQSAAFLSKKNRGD